MKQLDFGRGSITRNILYSSIPMMVAQLINLLYSLVDRVYIARIPEVGTEALGGLGLTFPVIILITAFTALYSGGGATLFAIARGGGKVNRAEKIEGLCFFLEIVTAAVLMAFGMVFAEPILNLFGAKGDGLLYALPYLRIYLTGTVFSMVSAGMNPFINAQGFPVYGMISVVTGAVLNIILDPVLIFACDMGIRGAAVATVISQAVSACMVVIVLLSRRMPIGLSLSVIREKGRKHSGTTGDDKSGVRRHIASQAGSIRLLISQIITLGFSSFIMLFTNALVSIVCNAVLLRTGGQLYVSIMTIISSLRQLFETPILAICDGASPVISYNYGAGLYDRVRRSVRVMSYMSLGYTFIIWILMMVIPDVFIRIFSNDTAIFADSMPAVRVYFIAFMFMTLQFIGQTTYKALNRRARAIFFSIFRKVIIVVPLTYLLPLIFTPSVNGVFAAEPVSNVIGGSASFFTMIFYIRSLGRKPETRK
ncbi:MAG: MATE family efflux transporter [Eubacterium sp.]|nr:MATE family efflux transporter [Eubacterium sp.]